MSDIKELVEALRGEGLGKAADELTASIEKNKKMTNALMKQIDSVRVKANKQLNEYMKNIKRLEDDYESLEEADKKELVLLKERAKELSKLAHQVHQVTEKNERLSTVAKKVTDKLKEQGERVVSSITGLNLFSRAIDGIMSLYDTWFSAQTELVQSMGALAMQTGASRRQMTEFQASASELRGTFVNLGGSLIGWADSLRFVGEASMAFRTEVSGMSQDLLTEILATERGLGLSADETNQLFRSLRAGINGGNEDLGDFTLSLREFSAEIGANASTMASDFIGSRDALARFGSDGVRVFTDTAVTANRLGFETRRLLDMAAQFDRFGAASDNVNQLNAMFGTTISSFELMMEDDPVTRIASITNAIREQGLGWNDMTRMQHDALAQSMGVSVDDAMRLFEGTSMEQIEADRAASQAAQEAFTHRQTAAQETLFSIIEATSQRFFSWRDQLQRIWLVVSEALAPVFEAFHDSSTGIAESIGKWVRHIASNPEFQNIIKNIADWIRELPNSIEEFMPTWTEMRNGATEMWPVIRQIGEVLGAVFRFASDHPGVVAAALGVAAVMQMSGGIAGIAGLFSPAGALLLGAAAFGVMMADAAGAADRMAGRLTEVNRIQAEGGMLTGDERRDRAEAGSSALIALRHAGSARVGGPEQATGMMRFGRILAGGAGRASEFAFGETDFSRQISTRLAVGDQLNEGNFRSLAETAIQGGASTQDVVSRMMASIGEHPDNEAYIRRSFGLSEREDLVAGLYREVGSISSASAPAPSEIIPVPQQSAISEPSGGTSAVDSAPVTQATTSAAPSAMGANSSSPVEIIASDVVMDGRKVGQVMFQVARRA